MRVFSHGSLYHRCTNEDLFGQFNSYFDWVEFARYKGRYKWKNGEELDFWFVEVGVHKSQVTMVKWSVCVVIVMMLIM